MKSQIVIALKILLVMTILTGLVYPLLMTGIAQLAFNSQANGSLVVKDGKIIGSKLIGQKFDSIVYFWSRPSAIDYNPLPSGASNYGPTSIKLKQQVDGWRHNFIVKNELNGDTMSIPKEMIFASASGLDPDISPESAMLQLNRVVKARKFSESQRLKTLMLIKSLTRGPQFSIFGESTINIFELNLALDNMDHSK
jgi:K+-transporting ATPase ATPase C chain